MKIYKNFLRIKKNATSSDQIFSDGNRAYVIYAIAGGMVGRLSSLRG